MDSHRERAFARRIQMEFTRTRFAHLFFAALLASAGGPVFAVSLETWRHGGVEGDGFLCVPGGEPPFPAVVLNHGRMIDDRGLGAARRKGYDPEALCAAFARDGYLALLPIRRNRSNMKAALREVMSAVELVRARPDVDRDRVSLGGHSRGGLLSLIAAVRGAPVRSYFLLAPAPGGRGMAERLLRGAGRVNAPMLVMFERSDKFGDIGTMVDRLEAALAAAGKPHEVFRYDRGGGHDLFLTPGYYWPDLMRFLRDPPAGG
jgi:dienelactone hydrolase